MVEVLEYALVVSASAMMAVFSFGIYGAYAEGIDRSSAEASYASVVAIAHAAIRQGTATATVSLNRASIGCVSDELVFSSPTYSGNSSLPVHCEFPPQQLSGSRSLTFTYSGGGLVLRVR